MNILPSKCPLCGGELAITRLHCHDCDTTFEGRFIHSSFGSLNAEQLSFLEIFIRNEGKFSRMEDEIKLSYPTMRNRLHEIIRAMGYEPGGDDAPVGISDEKRQSILDDLDKGRITAETAMRLLQERGG
jgi:hypothetical protein